MAREIARVLKCQSKAKGYIEGPQYVVTWALGHLVTLAEPEDYDKKYKEWTLETLPMLPEPMRLKVMGQTSNQFQVVRNLMRRDDLKELIIATDAGREGELVARWIMAMANWRKPSKRLWISSQTDEAIRQGFANLKPGSAYNPLYEAAQCRAEADWLIGLNVTRALTCKYNAQLSAGRVQTPTLAMIVDREREIQKFVPVDYWTLRADFGDYYADWRSHDGQSRLFDQAKAEGIATKVNGQAGTVIEVKKEAKSEPAPLAYDLTELQRDANRRYGFPAQKTLAVLQDLYEIHKLVSYPRTDSRYISRDIVPTLPTRLKAMGVGPYAELARPLIGKPLTTTKRFVDDSRVSDHHAIIPTEQPLRIAELKPDERNLYDLIARRFIAVLYPPFRYEQITLVTEVAGERFYARGKVVRDAGWRSVTVRAADRDEGGDEELPEQTLMTINRGERRQMRNCKANRAKTKPPARYTEATLLTAMESPGKFIEDEELREAVKQGGLGTPATRAEIIEKIIGTFYVERQGKELVPTSKGSQLVDLVAPELRSPELTAQWEQQLSEIARGKGSRERFMTAIRQNAAKLVKSVVSDTTTYHPDNVTKTKCPVCGKYMLMVKGKRGKMLVCPDRSCGHRQSEREETGVYTSSRKDQRVNQRLIDEFSDQGSIGTSLGDLLKAALEKKGEKK